MGLYGWGSRCVCISRPHLVCFLNCSSFPCSINSLFFYQITGNKERPHQHHTPSPGWRMGLETMGSLAVGGARDVSASQAPTWHIYLNYFLFLALLTVFTIWLLQATTNDLHQHHTPTLGGQTGLKTTDWAQRVEFDRRGSQRKSCRLILVVCCFRGLRA